MDYNTAIGKLGYHLTSLVSRIAKKRVLLSPHVGLSELRALTISINAETVEEWYDDVATRYETHRRAVATPTFIKTSTERVLRVLQEAAPSDMASSYEDISIAFGTIARSGNFESVSPALLAAHGAAISATNGTWDMRTVASVFVERPLVDSLIPPNWWEMDRASEVKVRRLALRVLPPTVLVEYEVNARHKTLRHKTVHLGDAFRDRGPLHTLAKRVHLHLSFAGLSLPQIEQLLVTMQKLCAVDDHDDDPVRPSPPKKKAAEVNKADLGLLYRNPDAALANVDLQDADDIVVKEFKSKMDEAFAARKLQPGDPGYEYDVRKEFRPTKKSEWDDNDED